MYASIVEVLSRGNATCGGFACDSRTESIYIQNVHARSDCSLVYGTCLETEVTPVLTTNEHLIWVHNFPPVLIHRKNSLGLSTLDLSTGLRSDVGSVDNPTSLDGMKGCSTIDGGLGNISSMFACCRI